MDCHTCPCGKEIQAKYRTCYGCRDRRSVRPGEVRCCVDRCENISRPWTRNGVQHPASSVCYQHRETGLLMVCTVCKRGYTGKYYQTKCKSCYFARA